MAKLGVGMIRNLLLVIIMLIILFTVLADTAADVGDAADNISTGEGANVYPLTSFFKRKGIILLSLIAGVIIVLITGFLDLGSGK